MAYQRFRRNYELQIVKGSRSVTVIPEFNISFDCLKSIDGMGINKLNCEVFGLSEDNRNILIKDIEEQKIVSIRLKIGYQGKLGQIFQGQLHRGSSQLTSGGYSSKFECLDGGFDYFNSFTSKTVIGKNNAVSSILEDMPNTEIGKLTQFPDLVRPKVIIGNSYQKLQELAGDSERVYIDNGKINILKSEDVIGTYIPVVNADSGLIGTPTRENKQITFETIMNPQITLGGRVKLESLVSKHLNGIYKVQTIGYKGELYGNSWNMSCTGFLAGDVVEL